MIVEDEPLAAQTLRDFIADVDWLTFVGHALDGNAALELIERLTPELIFLDVRLPGINGLDLLARIPPSTHVVFTTAFDHYAITAFELGAIDYLLKPFSRARFQVAAERVRGSRLGSRSGATASPHARFVEASAMPLGRLFVWKRGDLVPLNDRDIVFIQAEGDYVQIATEGDQFLVEVTLTVLLRRLDPSRFFRIHRSTIVNLDYIVRLTRHDDGRASVFLKNSRVLTASRTGTRSLLARFKP